MEVSNSSSKNTFRKKKNQLHGRGKNPIRYLRKYRGLLFFSHAALEDKYKMLPTYCPRDELKFIPRAEFAISYLSSMRLGKKTKKPCYFPGAKYTFWLRIHLGHGLKAENNGMKVY